AAVIRVACLRHLRLTSETEWSYYVLQSPLDIVNRHGRLRPSFRRPAAAVLPCVRLFSHFRSRAPSDRGAIAPAVVSEYSHSKGLGWLTLLKPLIETKGLFRACG